MQNENSAVDKTKKKKKEIKKKKKQKKYEWCHQAQYQGRLGTFARCLRRVDISLAPGDMIKNAIKRCN